MSALADVLRWGRGQFSLDPQPEQDLLSPQTAGDMALGMIPGVGQAMALRDMERARRAEDPVAGGLAAASLLPFGKLAGAVKNQLIAGRLAKTAPLEELGAGHAALRAGKDADQVWQDLGVFQGTENHAPMKWEIPDQKAKIDVGHPKWSVSGGDMGFDGKINEILRHDQAFAAYPHLAELSVLAHISPHNLGEGAFYAGRTGQPGLIEASARTPEELRQILLHELQHGIQAHEGFDRGANYNTIKDAYMASGKVSPTAAETRAFNTYRNNMGEAESRAVENRLNRSESMNRSESPIRSYDVPLKNLLSEDDLAALAKKLRQVAPSD